MWKRHTKNIYRLLTNRNLTLKAQLEKIQEKRKEEEKKVLDDDPEVEEFTSPLKKIKKLEKEDNFNRLCELMEESQYEKLTARIEYNQLITQDIENRMSKLRQGTGESKC